MVQHFSFKNAQGLTLQGYWWKAPSSSIIVMAHGSGSNHTGSGLFTTLAQAFQENNYNVLTFDFSGHGTSDDCIFSLQQSVEDVGAALNVVKAQGFEHIILLGHSLGAYACLANYSSSIARMILIGGLTGPVDWKWESMCSNQQIEAMKKTGYIRAEINDGLRAILTIDGKLLDDLRAINQKDLLSTIQCPVLIIHGDADQQERDLWESTAKGLGYFSVKPLVEHIAHAGHSFSDHKNDVAERILSWLENEK